MPICPNCKEKINYLNYSKNKYNGGEFSIGKDGLGEYEIDGNADLIEPQLFYSCPECSNEFNFDEDEAIEFLINKDELQEIVAEKMKGDKKE